MKAKIRFLLIDSADISHDKDNPTRANIWLEDVILPITKAQYSDQNLTWSELELYRTHKDENIKHVALQIVEFIY